MAHQIAIVNRSTVLSDDEVHRISAALQTQVSRDLTPLWGSADRELRFIPSTESAPKGLWWVVVLDGSDQAGARGYHDITPDGLPIGKAFAATDLMFGMQPSVTVSHELLEMIIDPSINLTAQSGPNFYAYEICDPCEDDVYSYGIDGVRVSDFVTPAWFRSYEKPGTRFDYAAYINSPLQVLKGGFAQYLNPAAGTGWHLVLGDRVPQFKARPPIGSRRERRTHERYQWVESTGE